MSTCSCVYHVALLRFVGCTSDASETATLAGGDDVAFNARVRADVNAGAGEGLRFLVRHLGEDLPLGRRIGRVARALVGSGRRAAQPLGPLRGGLPPGRLGSACRRRCATRSRTPTSAGTARGYPDGLAGDEVPIAIRVVDGRPGRRAVDPPGGLGERRRGARPPARPRVRPHGGRRADRRTARGGSPDSSTTTCARRCWTPSPTGAHDRGERIDERAGRGRRLRRPQVAVLPGSLDGRGRRWRRPRPRRRSVRRGRVAAAPGRDWSTTSVGSAFPPGSGTGPGR